jgi:hypothetical protein
MDDDDDNSIRPSSLCSLHLLCRRRIKQHIRQHIQISSDVKQPLHLLAALIRCEWLISVDPNDDLVELCYKNKYVVDQWKLRRFHFVSQHWERAWKFITKHTLDQWIGQFFFQYGHTAIIRDISPIFCDDSGFIIRSSRMTLECSQFSHHDCFVYLYMTTTGADVSAYHFFRAVCYKKRKSSNFSLEPLDYFLNHPLCDAKNLIRHIGSFLVTVKEM